MNFQTLQSRFFAPPAPSPAAALRLRPGTRDDYAALARFHYRAARPATVRRVIVLEYTDARGRTQPVGVLVESFPALACSLRDHATRGRYARFDSPATAADLINAEVRCISRVVVHPRWRGLGLAVRLVRHALATATTPVTEALAAMGHVHPFFEKAGMTAHRRPPSPRDQRLLDALRYAGLEPWELACRARIERRLAEPSPRAALLRRELSRWAGRGKTLEEQLRIAARKPLCAPVYYIKIEPRACPGSAIGDRELGIRHHGLSGRACPPWVGSPTRCKHGGQARPLT